MLMDIIVIIILFGIGYVIVDTITAIKNARHKSNLPEVAKNASETKKIISCLKSASTAKVDRVECRLSVYEPIDYHGCEIIALYITLYDSELAHIYAEAKGRVHSARESVKCTHDMPMLNDRIQKETQHIYEVIASYFPQNSDTTFLESFSVMNDSSIIISANSITVPIYCSSDTLGIERGKGPIRSPYVLDAVAEAAKDIPNISLTIDKTIPTKKK